MRVALNSNKRKSREETATFSEDFFIGKQTPGLRQDRRYFLAANGAGALVGEPRSAFVSVHADF